MGMKDKRFGSGPFTAVLNKLETKVGYKFQSAFVAFVVIEKMRLVLWWRALCVFVWVAWTLVVSTPYDAGAEQQSIIGKKVSPSGEISSLSTQQKSYLLLQ